MPKDRLAIGTGEVKPLLLLLDTNEDGKVSKQEFMKFMEAEFERLIPKEWGLNVKELTKSKAH